jgi:hypothetical protein
MDVKDIPTQPVSDWQPITDKVDLAYLGKLGEEISECAEKMSACAAAIFRCIIQGINEKQPVTGVVNKHWLEDEIADVQMMFDHLVPHLELDTTRMMERRAKKYFYKKPWFDGLKEQRDQALQAPVHYNMDKVPGDGT